MERAGLVVRRQCPSDGRGVTAHLTERGLAKLVDAAPDHVDSVRSALIDVVSAEDLTAIGRAFSTVAEALETGEPDPVLSPKSA
jgi:DNA-binding MarR family transcriptional regulator